MTSFDKKIALKNRLLEELDDMRSHVTGNWEVINSLRTENNKYREVLEALPQSFYLKNEHLCYLLCSKRFASDLNKNVEDIIGKHEEDLVPAELAKERTQQEIRILQSGQPEEAEEIRVIEGQERTFITVKTPTNGNGGVSGIFGVSVDISTYWHKVAELNNIIQQMENLLAGQSQQIASLQSDLERVSSERRQQEEEFKSLITDYEKSLSLRNIEISRLKNELLRKPLNQDEALQALQKKFHELKITVDSVRGYLEDGQLFG